MKTMILDRAQIVETALAKITGLVAQKPEAVIALSVGETCLAVYRALADAAKGGELSLSGLRFFSVTELEGVPPDSRHSHGQRIKELFLEDTDADARRFFVPDAADPARYDEEIARCGGLDLAILDIGVNARIGFNEPATPFDSRTHRQKLTRPTRRELAEEFGGEENVPVYGLSMGIKTLVEAKEILVLAEGEEKSKAVFHMLYGRDDSIYPAAFLQIPPQVTVLVDAAAASKL